MIKYSLQNECLENIEAFSDEQMNREMAVIESVLEIYDKTILMMELSNSDVNIPDCSMFMESTFFQELNETPTENAQPTNGGEGGEVGQSAPATQDGQQQNNGQTGNNSQNANNNNNTQKTPPTEAERKKYNSEHQFRQMNKKGNTENMFISIIAFIPRLLGFLIQCIVKLFKKIGNKKGDEAINNTDKNLSNLNDEQKKQLAAEINNESSSDGEPNANDQSQNNQQPAQQQQNQLPEDSEIGMLDVITGKYKFWNERSITDYLLEIIGCLNSLNLKNPDDFYNSNTAMTAKLKKLIEDENNRRKVIEYEDAYGEDLVGIKQRIEKHFAEIQELANTKMEDAKQFEEMVKTGGKKSDPYDDKTLKNVKLCLSSLKDVIKRFAGFTNLYWTAIQKAAANAIAVEEFTRQNPVPPPSQADTPPTQQTQPNQTQTTHGFRPAEPVAPPHP